MSNAKSAQVRAAVRRKTAVKLRIEGLSTEQIRVKLKYSSTAAVRKDIRRELKEYGREETEELMEMELLRLDELYQVAFEQAKDGSLWATDRCLAIMERRSSYLGLDNQNKQGEGYSQVDRWLAGIVDPGVDAGVDLDPDSVLGEEVEVPDELDD